MWAVFSTTRVKQLRNKICYFFCGRSENLAILVDASRIQHAFRTLGNNVVDPQFTNMPQCHSVCCFGSVLRQSRNDHSVQVQRYPNKRTIFGCKNYLQKGSLCSSKTRTVFFRVVRERHCQCYIAILKKRIWQLAR